MSKKGKWSCLYAYTVCFQQNQNKMIVEIPIFPSNLLFRKKWRSIIMIRWLAGSIYSIFASVYILYPECCLFICELLIRKLLTKG